ncbi:hypothetical protein [Thermosporothrix hazakensis]|nr:hypothetical protein [Thermosporothrix hazakensis]
MARSLAARALLLSGEKRQYAVLVCCWNLQAKWFLLLILREG